MDIRMRTNPYQLLCLSRLPVLMAVLIIGSWCVSDATLAQQPVFKTPTIGQQRHLDQTPTNGPQFRAPAERTQTAQDIQRVSYESGSNSQVIEKGIQLESKGSWAEALTLYQKALKKTPKDNKLVQRRSVARIHYDLERRYSDSSFLKTISSTNGTKALNVYSEVLLKVQSYYVDEPNWGKLANFGLTSLEVALKNPYFRKQNLNGISAETISRAFDATLRIVERMPASSRQDIYLIASKSAETLQKQIGLPVQTTVYEFVCGAISALDPYSAFMSSNQYSETMSQIEGNFVGLGVELKTHTDNLEIVSVIPGGSASNAGVKAGDRIVSVAGVTVEKAGSERAADKLIGVEGTKVKVTIQRGDQQANLDLERRRVELQSVDKIEIIDPAKKIGYIRVTNFQKTTPRDFDAALWKLHRQGMQSLIVDVRGNPGGLLSASVEVADRFVGSGVIVSTRGRNPMEDYTHQAQMANTWGVPLVVLVDENSASASEIFAAAIRDHRRGTIVGRQSYGKGSVQGIFPLNVSGGGVRLTTAKFYSPKGQAISEVGVKADVEVYAAAKPTDSGKVAQGDEDMRVAVQVASRMMAQRQTQRGNAIAGR